MHLPVGKVSLEIDWLLRCYGNLDGQRCKVDWHFDWCFACHFDWVVFGCGRKRKREVTVGTGCQVLLLVLLVGFASTCS